LLPKEEQAEEGDHRMKAASARNVPERSPKPRPLLNVLLTMRK
jgi:hypothetical protein